MEDFIKHLHEEYPHTHLDLIEKEFEEFDKKGRGISKSLKNYNTDFENTVDYRFNELFGQH